MLQSLQYVELFNEELRLELELVKYKEVLAQLQKGLRTLRYSDYWQSVEDVNKFIENLIDISMSISDKKDEHNDK